MTKQVTRQEFFEGEYDVDIEGGIKLVEERTKEIMLEKFRAYIKEKQDNYTQVVKDFDEGLDVDNIETENGYIDAIEDLSDFLLTL